MPDPGPTYSRRRSRLAIVAASAAIALVAAVTSVYEIHLLPPTIEKRELQIGVAATRAVVDSRAADDRTPIDDLTTYNELQALTERAGPLAKVVAGPTVVNRVGHRLGVDPEQITAETQVTQSAPRTLIEPDSERRAAELLAASDPYRIEVQAEASLPVLAIYAKAPTAEQARRLADATVGALNADLRHQDRLRHVPRAYLVHLTQLGAARGGPVDATAPAKIAALTFLVVFGICCGVFILLARIRRGWRWVGRRPGVPGPPAEVSSTPAGDEAAQGDDWPHTTRLLPWMIAAFIAMLWLVPFNGVALDVSLPIDLNLDRLVLPVIVLTWVLALAVGGHGAPRWRFTAVHAGIAGFAAVAGLSVVLGAGDLDRTLILDLSIKKLTLLAAYISLFVVVASAVRPTEVPAFLKLILGLSLVCALGVIWESRFGYNVFYDLTSRALPGFFEIPSFTSTFDDIGRREVIGPTELGLEAVAILAMAFPIAIVGLMHAKRWRRRLLYGLATCVLGLAMLSTYRKSALLAPITVGMVLAYFRPRQALKLAPLAAVVVAVMAIGSFNAFDSVTGQFDSDRLDVGTVSDRVADYDAVRPDFLSHPAFGRGFGSYEHTFAPADNRILDSDLLLRVIETGLVGLAAFLLMIGTVIAVAAGVIRSGDPRRAPPALAIAAAAAAFLCLTALFDEWSFPHAVYLFLTLAGLLAVLVRSSRVDEPPRVEAALGPRGLDPVEPPVAVDTARRRLPTPVGATAGESNGRQSGGASRPRAPGRTNRA